MRQEIQGVACVIAEACVQNPALFPQTPEKLGSRHGLEQPDHCYRDAALLNELHHTVEDIVLIGIEAQDEPSHDLHAITLDCGHTIQQTSARVLQLLTGNQPKWKS